MAEHVSTSTSSTPGPMQFPGTPDTVATPPSTPKILTMPNDMIFEIAKYLLPHKKIVFGGPAEAWIRDVRKQRHEVTGIFRAFTDLLLTCKALRELLRPRLYDQVSIVNEGVNEPPWVIEPPSLPLLVRRLDRQP